MYEPEGEPRGRRRTVLGKVSRGGGGGTVLGAGGRWGAVCRWQPRPFCPQGAEPSPPLGRLLMV